MQAKNRLFKKVLIPIVHGCTQVAALNIGRAVAGEENITLVGLVYVPAGQTLSGAAVHAREVRQILKRMSNAKQIHTSTGVHASHLPWRELTTVIEKES